MFNYETSVPSSELSLVSFLFVNEELEFTDLVLEFSMLFSILMEGVV